SGLPWWCTPVPSCTGWPGGGNRRPGTRPTVLASRSLPTVFRKWQLIALCAGANLLEATLVLSFVPGRALSLSPQASAVASFGVFHDLRWLSVYSNSWAAAGAEISAAIALRALLIAMAVRWAWPDVAARP